MSSPDHDKGRVSTASNGRDIEQGSIASPEGPVRPSRIANPAPAGLFSFASTTFILSLYNLQAHGVSHPNVVVGMTIFAGGLAQFMAGMWEYPRGNVFGATVFSSYGAFWMSLGTIYIPASGIMTAYADPSELAGAIGIYLITWAMVTFFFLLIVLRKSIAFTVLLSWLTTTFILLAAAQFAQSVMVTKAGGVFGVITALIAYYIGISELLVVEKRPLFSLPLGVWQ
ncbi:FUN34 transmembrane protein [Mycena rebaudengoi]|nr:FUN34 transmembrane protein [Mycena rebaudengoi]